MFKKIQRWAEIVSTHISLWQALMAAIAFGVPAWAVRAAHIFPEYAPASWVIAGFAGFFVVCLGLWLAATARMLRQRARFQERISSTALINPLDVTFSGKSIKIGDLCPPVTTIIRDKVFVDCHIIGPANIIFLNCTQSGNGGEAVDGVLTKDGIRPNNGFIFLNCSFTRCKFYLATFLVPSGLYDTFKQYGWSGINWMTDVPDPMLPLNQGAGNVPQLPPGTEADTPP